MFGFQRPSKRKPNKNRPSEHDSSSDRLEPDSLNVTATDIARKLVECHERSLYSEGMKQIFKKTPSLIEDVDPKYRDKLRQILAQE